MPGRRSGYTRPSRNWRLSDQDALRFGPNGGLYVDDRTCGLILRTDSTGMGQLFATAPVT